MLLFTVTISAALAWILLSIVMGTLLCCVPQPLSSFLIFPLQSPCFLSPLTGPEACWRHQQEESMGKQGCHSNQGSSHSFQAVHQLVWQRPNTSFTHQGKSNMFHILSPDEVLICQIGLWSWKDFPWFSHVFPFVTNQEDVLLERQRQNIKIISHCFDPVVGTMGVTVTFVCLFLKNSHS